MTRHFVAALNGGRSRAEHAAVPLTPSELAADATQVARAGVSEVHIHPRGSDGTESLLAEDVAAAVQAVRMAAPGLRVSVTTGAWIEPDPRRRVRLIDGWTAIPHSATVNVHE
ncbi:MAG TPA: 3-keto-5-aminohexanoate cleavage protein, partial [Actinopolymorphaceae bacterium]